MLDNGKLKIDNITQQKKLVELWTFSKDTKIKHVNSRPVRVRKKQIDR